MNIVSLDNKNRRYKVFIQRISGTFLVSGQLKDNMMIFFILLSKLLRLGEQD